MSPFSRWSIPFYEILGVEMRARYRDVGNKIKRARREGRVDVLAVL